MKNFLKVSIIAFALVFTVNTKSFALVDAAAWGGYLFNGEIEDLEKALLRVGFSL